MFSSKFSFSFTTQIWSTKLVYLLASTRCSGKLGSLVGNKGTGKKWLSHRYSPRWVERNEYISKASYYLKMSYEANQLSSHFDHILYHYGHVIPSRDCRTCKLWTLRTYALANEWDQCHLKTLYPVFLHECIASIKLSMAAEHQANMCITQEISYRLILN